MKNVLLLFVILVWSLVGFAQQSYQIQELKSNEPIPFVKVIPHVGDPFLSDLDGYITLNTSVTSVQLMYSHFEDTTFVLSETVGNVLYM